MRRLVVSALLLAAAMPVASGQAAGYRIPRDNPFVSMPTARGEIYVYGLRNPYRWSFDRGTGDLYVADVGGNQREEITYLPRAAIAGANLGWDCFEGTLIQQLCRPPNLFAPAHEYGAGPDVVIGGHVVHDPALPSLAGRYLYARYSSGLYSLGPAASGKARRIDVDTASVTSIGEDAAGRVYVTSYDGPVHRLGETAGAVTLTKIGDFERPLALVSAPHDPDRLFVAEKRGVVWLLERGRAREFLDLRKLVRDDGYEEGLLGLALAPDYAESGRLFAYYVRNDRHLQLDEFRRSDDDRDRAGVASRRPLLRIPHDRDPYHHGGELRFGPDGHLYLGTGDGDRRVDYDGDAQSLRSLQGKILRLDVGYGAASPDREAPALHARTSRRQQVLRRRAAVAWVRCSESCSVVARGRLIVAGRAYPLRARAQQAGPGGRARITVRLTSRGRRALQRARSARGTASVRITLRARDPVGNRSVPARRIVLVSG